MVDQHTPGSDDDRAGLSASTDAPMGRNHAHARTHEDGWLTLTAGRRTVRIAPEALEAACRGGQAEDTVRFGDDGDDPALAWLAGYDPQDGKGGPIGETEGHEEFTRDVVLAAFEAGRVHKAVELALPLSSAVRLLTEASQTFRTYEGHHQDQAAALLREGRDNAGATEAWFEMQAGKVGDRLGKAARNRAIAERIEEFLLIDSTPHDRLTGLALSLVQDLDALMQDSGGVYGLHLNGDPAPWETLTAEGAFSDWLGSFDRLRDHLDALFPAGGIAGTHKAVQVKDPAATVRTIEAAVAGGLIPGIDEDRLSVARVEARLFPLGDIRNDTGGRATPSYGMDPEVVDALRQAHDGAS